MQPFEIVTENGKITHIYDNRYSGKIDITDGKGEFGSTSYTLRTEDVNTLPRDTATPHGDHICTPTVTDITDDTIVMRDKEYGVTTTINNKDYGIEFVWEYENDIFSKFAARLPLNFLSQKNGEWTHQFLVSSPYFNKDTGILTCMFTSPDKNNLMLIVKTHTESFRIVYPPELHFFTGFEIIDNLDRVYGNTPKNKGRIEAVLLPVSSYSEALEKSGQILGVPVATYKFSAAFIGGKLKAEILGECDEIKVVYPSGDILIYPAAQKIEVETSEYGYYKIIPYKNGKQGIECIGFAHNDWQTMYSDSIKSLPVYRDRIIGKTLDGTDVFMPPFVQYGNYIDTNLCEHNMWVWAQLRYMRHFAVDKNATDNIENVRRIILADNESVYRPRQTIIPVPQSDPEKMGAYNTYRSDRIQEAFGGANILIDFWRVYKEDEYLETAITVVENLLAYYMNDDGAIVRGRHGDYTTVTALIFPIADLYEVLSELNDKRAEKFKNYSIKIADFMVKRGLDFPTESEKSDKYTTEYEDGSISCTALTVLYVARKVQYKTEYIEFAKEIMRHHDAYCVYTNNAPMFNSSLRWWENLWEGDTDGPAICCGHAWSIWRGEALFWLGIESKDSARLVDSYNTYMSNFSKQDKDGNMYAIYQCEPCISGGEVKDAKEISRRYAVGFPKTKDHTLSRYAYARAYDTWFKCVAVLEDTVLQGELTDGNLISRSPFFSLLYIDRVGELTVKADTQIEIISPKTVDVLKGEIIGKTDFGIIVKPDTNGEITVNAK